MDAFSNHTFLNTVWNITGMRILDWNLFIPTFCVVTTFSWWCLWMLWLCHQSRFRTRDRLGLNGQAPPTPRSLMGPNDVPAGTERRRITTTANDTDEDPDGDDIMYGFGGNWREFQRTVAVRNAETANDTGPSAPGVRVERFDLIYDVIQQPGIVAIRLGV